MAPCGFLSWNPALSPPHLSLVQMHLPAWPSPCALTLPTAVILQIHRDQLDVWKLEEGWLPQGWQGGDRLLGLLFSILLFQGTATHLVDITGNLASMQTSRWLLGVERGQPSGNSSQLFYYGRLAPPLPADYTLLSEDCALKTTVFKNPNIHITAHFSNARYAQTI